MTWGIRRAFEPIPRPSWGRFIHGGVVLYYRALCLLCSLLVQVKQNGFDFLKTADSACDMARTNSRMSTEFDKFFDVARDLSTSHFDHPIGGSGWFLQSD